MHWLNSTYGRDVRREWSIILHLLKSIRENGPQDSSAALLANIGHRGYSLETLVVQWPEYSGNKSYPVKHPDLSTTDVYGGVTMPDRWDRTTEYGQANYRLIDWLIEQIEIVFVQVSKNLSAR
jgi:hypothetical protein